MKTLAKLSLATTLAVFLLITVGAFVRASGSGLGCPDWPHCYGKWIPPTTLDEVPIEKRAEANLTKTWIEYLNRLLGMTIGLLVVATTIRALMVARHRRDLVASAVAATLLTGFQGWQGGQVVKKHLDPRFVTVHLFLAFVIGMLLIHVAIEARREAHGQVTRATPSSRLQKASFFLLVVALIQSAIGALVRGTIDIVEKANADIGRDGWLEKVGAIDWIHRGMGQVVLFTTLVAAYAALKAEGGSRWNRFWAMSVVGIVAMQFLSAYFLAYRGLPPAAQVLHVTFSSLLVGLAFTQWWLQRPRPHASANRT